MEIEMYRIDQALHGSKEALGFIVENIDGLLLTSPYACLDG